MRVDGIPLFDSDYMNTGDKFSYTFTQPGRYDYFVKNSDNLEGTVFVKQGPV
jgi:plastocyanin